MRIALIGSVSSTKAALEGLLEARANLVGVLGIPASESATISDYADLQPLCIEHDVSFLGFRRVREPAVTAYLQDRSPDMLWCIGLSQLIPDSLTQLAPKGALGFHPTMLPEGRGRAPVAWTILKNARAAVNLFYLADEADAGDIVIQREVPVHPDDYSEDLIARTNEVLKSAVQELVHLMQEGLELPRMPQDHSRATFYPKRTPEDGRIDWTQDTDAIYRLVRAAGRPYPGAFASYYGAEVTMWRGHPVQKQMSSRPGTIVDTSPLVVATGDGHLAITDWQWRGPIGSGFRLAERFD